MGSPFGIPSTMTGQSPPQNHPGRQRPESTLQPNRASALLRRVTGISRRAALVEAQLQRSKL